MKTIKYLPIAIFLISCGGDAETSENDTNSNMGIETDSIQVDTVDVVYTYEDFNHYLTTSDPKDLNNADTLYAKFDLMKGDFTQEEKDEAFNDILTFLNSVEVTDDEYQWERDGQDQEMKEKYEPHGLIVGADEGMFYVMPNMQFLSDKFSADLSKELSDYIDFQLITNKPMYSDAGLIIPFGELGDMLFEMEDLMRTNSESKYFKEMISTYRSYLWTYLWGLDNTPILTWEEPKELMPEVKQSYDKALNDSDHGLKEIVSIHLEYFDENGYIFPSYDNQWVPSVDEIEELLDL